jgi:hypothetical protein
MALRFLNSGYFAGKVGIGTESPVAKLELGTNDFIMVNAGAGGRAGILFNETGTPSATNVQYGARISYKENGDVLELVTRENNVDKLGIAIARLTGYVGIGTDTSINNPLTVSKDAGGNALAYFNSLNTNGYGVAIRTADAGNDKYILRLDSAYSSAPVMYASNAGNVGIGTDSPNYKLDIEGANLIRAYNPSGSASIQIKASANNNSSVDFADPNDTNVGQIIYRHADNSMSFDTNDIEKMRITSGGNVGIGTTSPSEKLSVAGNMYLNGVLYIGSRGIYQQQNTDVSGLELVANASTSLYRAAFFDYVIQKQGNVRAGTVFACNDGTSVEYTETSTNDIGDTSDVVLSVDISGTNMRLLADAATSGWSVKSLIRAI